jgi:exonuclease SbcC
VRILAIRGSNLTSLAGDFALELDQPPLDTLGLFAISGATGAGKSTLLDAMCLALFDRTPRLGDRGGAPVGRPEDEEEVRLQANDVRGMLRRGAGEGFAEVDFLGKDGKRYRARWSVWRARSRADGRFRPQEMKLTEVATEQTFGRTKSEVLKAIEERLGLSFDQFRRSALLAQGEFAAFLRADANERAELLERMTGTEVYSRLSMATHERHKVAQAELEKLAQGVAAIARLSEEERAGLETSRGQEEAALAAARQVQAQAERAADWYAERTRLVAQEAEAEGSRARAAEALQAAAPREAELAQVRAAEVLRAPLARADEAARRLETETATRAARQREAEVAREGVRAREAALAQAEVRRAEAQEAEASARPALEEAGRLDVALEQARRESHEAAQRLEAAREAERLAWEEAGRLAREEAAASAEVEAARTWLTEHAHVEALAREWPRWEAELARHERATQEEAAARGALTRWRAAAESLEAEAVRRREEHQVAGEALKAADAEVARAEAAVGEDAGAERGARRDSLLSRQEVLRALSEAYKATGQAVQAEQEAAEEASRARREEASAKAEAEAERARGLELAAALREAQRALEATRSALGFTAHRAELHEGEPCPLCGAKEHPYAREAPALEGLLADAQARVEALNAQRTEATRGEAAASTRAAGAGPRAAQAESRREAAAKQRAQQREVWASCRGRLEGAQPAAEVEAPGVQAWLEEAEAQVRSLLAALKDEEARAEALARAVREARAAQGRARERREAAEKASRLADEALRGNTEEQRKAEAEATRAAGVCQEVLAGLAGPLAGRTGWEAALARNPAAFRARCTERVSEWNTREKAQREAEARVAEVRGKRGLAEARVEERQAASAAGAQAWEKADAVLRQTQAARAALLGGRPTVEVRTGLLEAVAHASRHFEAVRTEAEQAKQVAAVAATRADETARALEEAGAAHVEAEAALVALLSAQHLTRESARALLARGAAWVEAEAQALAVLREAQSRALTVLKERQAWRSRHEDSGLPALPEAEVAAACERARADTEARRQATAALKARLDQDDEARRRHGEQARLLEERQRASGVWRTLNELIGSHDGKKFKVFAQSLTLDALLHHANAHLEELAPRYRLMRVPRYDLDLQVVDRDMGDEVRSVSSLSGGESFLVSLALALGLASLSSETTQVETLFIDEGFGTLDPETLEMALATLDALQATGRQVGIISHVSGLAERIGTQVRVVKQGAGRSRLVVTHRPHLVTPQLSARLTR